MSWLGNLFSTPKPPPVIPTPAPPGVLQAPGTANYTDVAGQQTASNAATLAASQKASLIGQNNAYGSEAYTQNSDGSYTLNQNLSSPQQALLQYLQGSQATAGQQAGNLLTGAGYGAQDPADVIGNATQGNTASLIAGQMQQLAPQQQQQRQQLDTALRNQGINPGSPAYDQQMRQYDIGINNTNAANASNFENQAYNQALQNYELPASMAQSLAQFGSPVNLGSMFGNTPTFNMGTTDVGSLYGLQNNFMSSLYSAQQGGVNSQYGTQVGGINAQNQANMTKYTADLNNQSNLMKGIFSLGGSVLGGPIGGMLGNSIGGMFGGSGTVIPGTAQNGGWTTSY